MKKTPSRTDYKAVPQVCDVQNRYGGPQDEGHLPGILEAFQRQVKPAGRQAHCILRSISGFDMKLLHRLFDLLQPHSRKAPKVRPLAWWSASPGYL
jgi:hypothetical protein